MASNSARNDARPLHLLVACIAAIDGTATASRLRWTNGSSQVSQATTVRLPAYYTFHPPHAVQGVAVRPAGVVVSTLRHGARVDNAALSTESVLPL